MATTYVYLTTSVDDQVALALNNIGTAQMGTTAKLLKNSVSKNENKVTIITLARILDEGMYLLDIPFTISGNYLVSLQILIHGHGLGSMIWWRWRQATAEIGDWYTDHNDHTTSIHVANKTYTFILTGKGTLGYDDIYLSLKVA